VDYVEQFWETDRRYDNNICLFCGKEAENQYRSGSWSQFSVCDCVEFMRYKEAYDECSKRLHKLSHIASSRRRLLIKKQEIAKKQAEIDEIEDNLDDKKRYRDYDINDQNELEGQILLFTKIKEDES